MDGIVADVLDAAGRGQWSRLTPLLHPYLRWTTGGVTLRGRRTVLAYLTEHPPGGPPDGYELRDGQVYRWAAAEHGADRAAAPAERFEALVDAFVGVEGVVPPGATRGFGRSALRVHGKIFAMLVDDRLVVKLPRARVDALVNAGAGVRFDAHKGTPMKEWFSLDPESDQAWLPLAREALAFVNPHRTASR